MIFILSILPIVVKFKKVKTNFISIDNLLPILFVMIIGLITHWQWFFISGIFSYGDTLWSSPENILTQIKLIIGKYHQ